MKIDKEIKQRIYLLLLVFLMLLCSFINSSFVVNADNLVVGSPVLEDLQQDSNFKVEDYPTNNQGFTLSLIQIAETTDKQLLVYVYNPSALTKKITASSINISLSANMENPSFKNYSLSFLNSNGVFSKYLVKDLEVKDEEVRYYNISSIYRNFDKELDSSSQGQTISEVAYEVGCLWTATTTGDEVSYTSAKIDVVTITNKFVGYVAYQTENVWSHFGPEGACNRHFVAFSTDKKIDELIEVDVEYQTQYSKTIVDSFTDDTNYQYEYGDIKTTTSHLDIDDKQFIKAHIQTNLFDVREFSYSWKNIQTVDEFLSTVNLENTFTGALFNTTISSEVKDSALTSLKSNQWVVTFDNTPATITSIGADYFPAEIERTIVSNVSILRLKFRTEGITYNLGAIDNKQTGSDEPINDFNVTTEEGTLFKILKIVLIVICCAVGSLVLIFVAYIFFLLGKGIVGLINKMRG